MPKPLKLTGKKFGKLTVIGKAGKTPRGSILWKCVCVCGRERTVEAGHLMSGHTRACGVCLSSRRRNLLDKAAAKNMQENSAPTIVDLNDLPKENNPPKTDS